MAKADMPTVVHITTVHNVFDNRIFYRECISLSNAGFKVVLIAPNSHTQYVSKINIRSFSCPKNRFGRMTLGVFRALRIAIKHGEKIFHFHDPEFIVAGLLLKIMGKHVIYDIHEDNSTALLEREYLPIAFRKVLSKVLSKLEQIATIPFFHVLAERYYSERFPRGRTILNYAQLPDVDEETLNKRPVNGQARLLYTGNVKSYRGAHQHVQILHNVPKAEIFLVGRCEDSMAKKLREKAGKYNGQLHIEGVDDFIPFERIIEYYQSEKWLAGLAIFPHSKHTLKKELTKIFEYMMYGLPVICSNVPNLRDIVENHECGLCVDPKKEQDIANAVQFLIEHPQEGQKMGKNGLHAAKTHYHWGTQEKKLISLYQEMN